MDTEGGALRDLVNSQTSSQASSAVECNVVADEDSVMNEASQRVPHVCSESCSLEISD